MQRSAIILSLHIDPRSVDVNVHPTKKEVHFLNEDAIIERIADAIQESLIGQSQSRTFEYQVRYALLGTPFAVADTWSDAVDWRHRRATWNTEGQG